MGLEECVPQCRDPLLMQLKEKALLERETLLAEVRAAESQHQARHTPSASPRPSPNPDPDPTPIANTIPPIPKPTPNPNPSQARREAQQHVWALVARIEMMARLKAASIEVGGQGQA